MTAHPFVSIVIGMAPKTGGKGNKSAQNYVRDLWEHGLSEQEIRKQLKEDGYKAGRITQLLKATRPAEGQEGVAAAAAKELARPAKRPAASSEAGSLFFFSAALSFCWKETSNSGHGSRGQAACSCKRFQGRSGGRC